MWLFWYSLFCWVLFLYICYFICHHLHFCILCFHFNFFFFFYICSSNCQLISCNTSENVSPVKQVSRKSPSDTEGLVKSLPSGSHQVTADCGLPTVPCAAVWCCVVFWDAEKNHTKLWESETERQSKRSREECRGWFRRNTGKYVEKNLTWVKVSTKPPLTDWLKQN